MSNGALKLALVAAATTAATGVLCAAAFSAKSDAKGTRQHFDVPPEMLDGRCDHRDEVVLAVRLAVEAGKNMMRHYDSKGTAAEDLAELDIATKGNAADFATAIDVANERFIASEIKRQFPTHDIIGEEAVGTGAVPPLTDKETWIIDPIDGTTNFAAGLPLSCVSIGFCRRGQPHMGVVYAPMTHELYVAVRGRGAYRNGVRLRGCTGDKAAKTLADAVVCFEFGYARSADSVDRMADAVRRLLHHGLRTTRTLGSGVLDLCYVACGRMDVAYTGVADEGWSPWDYCAGIVVALEAGCTVTHLTRREEKDVDDAGVLRSGYDFNLYSRSMICGVNQKLVEECRDVVLGSA